MRNVDKNNGSGKMKTHEAVKRIRSQGRYGDSTLVHMSEDEVAGLASLHPMGKLPRNPVTGLPEAFELWPLLGMLAMGGIGGLALPALLGAGAAGLGGTAAAGAGAGAAASGGIGGGLTGLMSSPWFLPGVMMAGTGLDLLTQEGPPEFNDDSYDRRERRLKRKWDPRTGMFGESSYPLYNPQGYAYGGTVEGYAAGGIVGEEPFSRQGGFLGGQMAQMGMMGQEAGPMGQLDMSGASMMGQGMPTGGMMDGMTPPQSAPSQDDMELVRQAMAAIGGQHPNPGPILRAFVERFGEEALQDLVARMKGGMASMQSPDGFLASGSGDGMSDSIPALVNGQRPASLSDGEFVVPAQDLANLGNGSNRAGAEALKGMLERLRTARTGSPAPARPVDPMAFMPA